MSEQHLEINEHFFDTSVYIKDALRTCSYQYYGDKVPLRILEGHIGEAIKIGNRIDTIKKSLFYGKPNHFAFMDGYEDQNCNLVAGSQKAINIIHGILGVFTEAVELLEALAKPDVDTVNIKEEVGDLFWYLAILAHTCEFSFEEAMQINIAKLHARFPDKFTEDKAINRDLEVERAILEDLPNLAKPYDGIPCEDDEILDEACEDEGCPHFGTDHVHV